jgi:NRAMP (natural resistance-associated macrophage protein)-like metal ion transporter
MPPARRTSRDRRSPSVWRALGPGIISGAADDDPSGIATYSIAGAQFGTALLWTALLTWPLMAGVQAMCARIGMVTGKGLLDALAEKFPRPALGAACVALFAANTINVGADLAGMADAAALLTHVSSHVWVVLFSVAIVWATVELRYRIFAHVLTSLAVVLLAYVVTAFVVHPPWGAVLHDTLLPNMPAQRGAWATLVALLGTTISPYLFFWQAAEEVEEEKAEGRKTLAARRGATRQELHARGVDIGVGSFVSQIVMFFIILTTALTLHRHGVTHVETGADVAEALRPLAGKLATLLYAVGIVGTGALAIPTLAGSAAYAFAELFGWRTGVDERFRRAPGFYAVLGASVAVGAAMNFGGVAPVRALFWSAVLNGLLAPVLLTGVLVAASDARLMQGQPSPLGGRVVVGVTTLAMYAAAVAMFVL